MKDKERKMSNLLDLIMASDRSKFERPTKELKLKRLSEILGNDAVIKIRAIGFDRLDELRETSDAGRLRLLIVCEGIVGLDLSNAALREHLGIDKNLPKTEVLKRIFLPGEIDDIYLEISKLSGYNAQTVEEIKKK